MFNENTRVKIPALVHLTRLGYTYVSLKDTSYVFDADTNIISSVFLKKLQELNTGITEEECISELQHIKNDLGYDDLGRAFYYRLIGIGDGAYKLIDWDNFERNSFHIATEVPCKNGEDEFRPDITVFINGLPLSFIEVKKPNNTEGIKAERDRIHARFRNDKFRKFINITQLIIFSNNMEYDDIDTNKLQGAFYATTAKDADTLFNNFREQRKSDFIDGISEIDERIEDTILLDTNYRVIKSSPEYKSNKDIDTPTNRILSSFFYKDRLRDILKYSICYVDEVNEDSGTTTLQKHIMRYPQFFASKAIQARLNDGMMKGVIWHTQGSGKTALAFYNVRILKDYFAKKGVVPKFYFIVDRLDLAIQAKEEFSKRGLTVRSVDDKKELLEDFAYNTATEGITVVNIQKFREDTKVYDNSGYELRVQRVFFIDEAHRSYDPRGSFLANLYNSDTKSIKIAMTGTPLIIYKDRDDTGEITINSEKEDSKTTRNIFGEYIHKYYYNDSIRDGYTLKLLREEIETSYKEKVRGIINDIKVQIGQINKQEVYAHEKFVTSMLEYIINDFKNSRIRFGEKSIGGMVVCDSSEQARMMYSVFNKTAEEHGLSAALILHDEDDKETRKDKTKRFKKGKIDLLFVYSMLLTGFDAPRLKKLYVGRKIRAHNLLQTLTRVNRPYKNFKLGYVVDFADISEEFAVTNQAYFQELNREYGGSLDNEDPSDVFGSLFMGKEEIDEQISLVQTMLADYTTENLETFTTQISAINNREDMVMLKRALESARDVYNIARLLGYVEIQEKLDFKKMARLLSIVQDRLKLVSLRDALNDVQSKELLNTAIEDVVFTFTKTGEEELKLLSEDVHMRAGHVRLELDKNINKDDPQWIRLYQSFVELLHKHHIDPNAENIDTMQFESEELKRIFNQIHELNRINSLLLQKFAGDRKFVAVFSHQQPSGKVSDNLPLYNLLLNVKRSIDNRLENQSLLSNQGYFRQVVGEEMLASFEAEGCTIEASVLKSLINLTADAYIHEYQGD